MTNFVDIEEPIESKELKRPRLDTGKDIFSQLTSVFNEAPGHCRLNQESQQQPQQQSIESLSAPSSTSAAEAGGALTTIVHVTQPANEVKVH